MSSSIIDKRQNGSAAPTPRPSVIGEEEELDGIGAADEEPASPVVREIPREFRGARYGSGEIIVHCGKAVQIERGKRRGSINKRVGVWVKRPSGQAAKTEG